MRVLTILIAVVALSQHPAICQDNSADPAQTEAALQNLKAAEAKHDLELIKQYSAQTSALARKLEAVPQPQDPQQAASWKQTVDYARQVDGYAAYSLYRVVLESRDPKVTIEFAELLQQGFPQSQYAGQVDGPLFLAYRQAGQNDKAMALAERVLATNQTDEDMLLVAADSYMRARTNPEKVHAYCARLVELMASKAKPAGMADDAWNTRKNLIAGQAHYMDGKLYWNENQFAKADTELRAALPLVTSSETARAEVLYLLGFANYKLEKPQEAANYYRECAALKSEYQAKAAKNLQAIKTEYRGIK